MSRLRLRADVSTNVAYDDRSPFGTPVSDRPDRAVREAFGVVLEAIEADGCTGETLTGRGMLTTLLADARFRRLVETDEGRAPSPRGWCVRDSVLYPDPDVAPPRYLTLARKDTGDVLRLQLPASHWPVVHETLAALVWPGLDTERHDRLHPDLEQFLAGLRHQNLIQEVDSAGDAESIESVRDELAHCPLTFLGHNTVMVRSSSTAVVIDPFLPARSTEHPGGYAPMQVPELGPVNAILITHSHPDHFAPATLLRFPPHTTVVVPRVERETIMTVAVGRRLRELGFTDVREVVPGDRLRLGDIDVTVMPFLGEQPTVEAVLHPEVRNEGCTYVVRTPDFSAAFLADSGRDGTGDVRDAAAAYRLQEGPVDVVFCGYRGWVTYPLQLLISSVARFALFVPPLLWGARQQLMCDAHAALDVAERFGARVLVPYADGGAPWHWELGLGPRMDGSGDEVLGFDPFPERVIEAASRRTQTLDSLLPSPVRVKLLRPCDSLIDPAGRAEIRRVRGHVWPYPG